MEETQVFQTSDFDLATFLYAKGVILQGIASNPENYRRKVFLFTEPPNALLVEFQSGEASVGIFAMIKAQNTLRDLLRGA